MLVVACVECESRVAQKSLASAAVAGLTPLIPCKRCVPLS